MKTFIITSFLSACLLGSSFLHSKPKVKEISQPIVLKSGETFDGEGVTYVLKEGSNCPMFIIGSLEPEPTERTKNVTIKNVILNGNRANQTEEIWQNGSQIRNNGITVRAGLNVIISNVTVRNCRSGGIVLEKDCSFISVTRCELENNQFDGLASYETSRSMISNVTARGNEYAGFSFDWDFNDNFISQCNLIDNKQQGIFLRDSKSNNFRDLKISGSKQGIFIACSELPNSECINNSFSCSFFGNGEDFRVNDAACVGNVLENAGAVVALK
jgi:parallel beta-helix repeat protein